MIKAGDILVEISDDILRRGQSHLFEIFLKSLIESGHYFKAAKHDLGANLKLPRAHQEVFHAFLPGAMPPAPEMGSPVACLHSATHFSPIGFTAFPEIPPMAV